ncbi:MAG: LPXTG cell wall anchor domain-containing protein [Proteobacteria bacterium]|nr:LPXTG cell wall anchor domain-containing protein [Pseudomonadota bacterium]MBS0554694.1 LPXTG cell wall anchor domain-containing protein [Pseudomonadota bacterium]
MISMRAAGRTKAALFPLSLPASSRPLWSALMGIAGVAGLAVYLRNKKK